MIKRRSQREIEHMRIAGRLAAEARNIAGKMVKPGVTTESIDRAVYSFIKSHGATPSFLGYRDYPASINVSVNNAVIHGIPSKRVLKDGDIVSIDVGVTKDGFIGDCAATFIAGEGSEADKHLIKITRECFYKAFENAKPGNRISDISRAVQEHAERNGFSVVREFTGHGVGTKLHESPEIPNFIEVPRRRADPRLVAGMTIAIEPMVNAGAADIEVLEDGWTVVTVDRSNSAHYENTILITDSAPEILTVCEDMP